jgi:hypothetical protein
MVATMTRTTYKALVTRDRGFWQIDFGDVGSTSTSRDHEIDLVAREYISLQENLHPFDFDISFEFTCPGPEKFKPPYLLKKYLDLKNLFTF